MNQNAFIVSLWVVISCLTSCAPAYKKHLEAYRVENPQAIPDYGRLEYWAAYPGKKSPADSIPAPIREMTNRDSTVDIFFLHPTTFGTKTAQSGQWNADINDPLVNAKTDYTTIIYQASVFNEYRVFAPRYRQANLLAYYSRDTARSRQSFDTDYADIRSAFLYYLEHINQGRPIIIASHSQGSTHAERLLKEFFENKPLKRRLVAAYIIGMAIPKTYYMDLRPCGDSAETGCFVGWRTFRRGYMPEFVQKEQGSSYVVNPLTWTTAAAYASKQLNRGAVLTHFNTVFPGLADAQIHEGVLWIDKPRFRAVFFFSPETTISGISIFIIHGNYTHLHAGYFLFLSPTHSPPLHKLSGDAFP